MNIRQEPAERQYGIHWRPADEVGVGSVGWRDSIGGRMKNGVVLRLCDSERQEGLRITVSRARARQIAIAVAQASGMHWTQPGPLCPLPKRLSRMLADHRVDLDKTALRTPAVSAVERLKDALRRATENCGSWMREARSRREQAANLLEAIEAILPSTLCGERWNLADDETVSITVTFGKLRAARAAVTNARGAA
jgi:hypothetical protein